MSNNIFGTAKVTDCTLGDNICIYNYANVKKSELLNNVSIGDFSYVTESILFENVEIGRRNTVTKAVIGKGTYTGEFTIIKHANVGKYCSISWNVSIGGANHDVDRLSMTPVYRIAQNDAKNYIYNSFEQEQCQIGNDVWIAAGAHILRNVKIGDGAVIGANAVVTKNVPPYTIVAGVPAKVIRRRFSEAIIKTLLEIEWWNFPTQVLIDNQELGFVKLI